MRLVGRTAPAAVAAFCAVALSTAPAAAAEVVGFTSPSGNVGCILTDDMVRCDIAERIGRLRRGPPSCPDFTDYGQGLMLAPTGTARFVCAGDTALGSGPVLAYGEYRAGGGMSCRSETSGMRCSQLRRPRIHALTRGIPLF